MSPLISRSHGAQDQWIWLAAVEGEGLRHGSFLDVGCGHPIEGSNTCELERCGWRGLLVDIDANPDLERLIVTNRMSPFACADAVTMDWEGLLCWSLPDVVDYLSFDVDGNAIPAFKNLPLDRVRFRYLTVEHDHYAFGDGPRSLMRATLSGLGYELLCPDVMCNGLVYEDWWIDPKLVDAKRVDRFRTSQPTECYDIVRSSRLLP